MEDEKLFFKSQVNNDQQIFLNGSVHQLHIYIFSTLPQPDRIEFFGKNNTYMSHQVVFDHGIYKRKLTCICDMGCFTYQYYLDYIHMVSYQDENSSNNE